ncbi:hypothetical protein ARC78_08770 [Stenotrophomonas pictorum JCM 9942]|uniref:Uncharacterized protein n=1 Tax=Stenotrophomonas pictorum JCM 9942 TaxID=1236960 RepID=A0A0R0AKY7_9GAMM|nr:hypothetical protein [Stenotrophomonas pictorum]KRG42770.1 hypothetical protein ARC78_08770 [Stenotrophomonas pictorum JCM 9942]
MRADKGWITAGAALLLGALAWGVDAAPPLEEEIVNPSEVVFEGGQAYADAGDGSLERLRSRQQDGETVYYRLVRYDNEFGYVADDDSPSVAQASRAPASEPVTPFRYYGSGHLYRPDFYNSPYNRDARQRYWGPGYFGSCSRYDGCKEVQLVPVVPYRVIGY